MALLLDSLGEQARVSIPWQNCERWRAISPDEKDVSGAKPAFNGLEAIAFAPALDLCDKWTDSNVARETATSGPGQRNADSIDPQRSVQMHNLPLNSISLPL
jgi:hypothetical protein